MKKKYFIVYEINEKNNDLQYKKEYDNIKELKKDYKLNEKTNISKYIATDCDNIKEKINNKYVIFKEIENG